MGDKNLRVVITADDKNLQSKLKKTEKTLKEFNKGTKASTDAAKGFGKGLLQGTTGLGGFTAGAAAAGVAAAALAVTVGRTAWAAFDKYDKVLDSISHSTANVAKVQSGFMSANLQTAASIESVATASSIVWGRLGREVSKDTERLVAQLGKWQDEAGFTGAALQNMATIAQRFNMTKQLGSAFGYVKAAAQDTAFGVDEISASMAAATPLASHLGYTIGELAKITNVLGKNGIGADEWASIMERQLVKFGYDTVQARKNWASLVKDINDPNYQGNKLALLEEYGLTGSRALDMMKAIKSGAFSGGELSPASMPTLKPEDWGEYLGTKWKEIEQKMFVIVDGLFKIFGPEGSFWKGDNTTNWDLPTEPGRITTETIVPTVPPEKMPITTETVPLGFTGPSPLATTAFGGVAYDFKDPFVQMTMDSQQASLKLEGNADVVEAKWRDGLAGIARSADYNMGSIKVVAGDAAQRVGGELTRQFYTLHTIFGDIGLDITDMQNALNEWGVSVPTLFDNILKGAERIGWEFVENLGLPYTKEEVTTFIQDMDAMFKQYGVNLGEFWKDCTDGVKTSTEEINKQAVDNLKLLAGDLIMTMSDMFATGEWDWKKLWKKTWQGLLAIAVDYVLKIIANEQFMLAAWAAIQQIIEGLKMNWVKVAAIAAGVAAGAGIIAGIVAKVKQNNEEGAGESSLYGGTPPPSVSPYPSTSSTSSTVIIQNPTFIGEIDDRSALAVGEGLAKAQSIRGAGTLAFA